MNAQEHIESVLTKVKDLFEQASTQIEALQPGERIPATKMAKEMALRNNLPDMEIYALLKLFMANYPQVAVLRGAVGGYLKLAPGQAPPVQKSRKSKKV